MTAFRGFGYHVAVSDRRLTTSGGRACPGISGGPKGPAVRRSGPLSRTVKLRLESRIGYVDLVHEMAEHLARLARFTRSDALNIGLAVREAFINAIKHGNHLDESKTVEIIFRQSKDRFRVRVRDQGAGFDGSHTQDPREDANLYRTSGRGIFFMKHFVDHVSFLSPGGKGTEVLLEKRLEPVGRAGRASRGSAAMKRRR